MPSFKRPKKEPTPVKETLRVQDDLDDLEDMLEDMEGGDGEDLDDLLDELDNIGDKPDFKSQRPRKATPESEKTKAPLNRNHFPDNSKDDLELF